ncbi:MAG: prepilin-type N-terminal cleavage/methylation domain-containing protein [Betaproteobacteria bacterium]|nr:MAG: prepilin-type N-terminal cleavage/methylation domain-containing protein [Betaproteobacteria bacterium]
MNVKRTMPDGIQARPITRARWRWVQRGFTLVELMVTVSVAAVLAMIAVPSFNDAMQGSKLNSLSNNFVASAHLARSEAIKRNATVTLCASSSGTTCGDDWSDGWKILADGAVIYTHAPLPNGFQMSEAEDVTSINFPPTGVGITAAALTLCKATPSVGSQKRSITVKPTGRPEVTKVSNATTCP